MVSHASIQDLGAVGVIDIGAHSIRLEIAQLQEDGSIETLERLSHHVPLGADVFTNGSISDSNIRLVGQILGDFARVLAEYGVEHRKAIATSAVREAENRDIFLHRVSRASGIELQILYGPEESRLMFMAVRNALGGRFGLARHNAIIFTVGTGASLISFSENGCLTSAETVRLGTLRLMEELEGAVSYTRLREIIDPFVAAVVNGIARISSGERPGVFVGVGSTVRALVSIEGRSRTSEVRTMSRNRFQQVFGQIAGVSAQDLADRHGLPLTLAHSLEPCCNMLHHFFEITDASRLIVPMVTTRDALIRDFVREIAGEEDGFIPQILSVAAHIACKYNCDLAHHRCVAQLATTLFDQLTGLHGMAPRARLLLEVAAYLHDVGMFVSSREHHRHSYYLVRNCEIPGISPNEQELLATISRYHRRSLPCAQHPEYTSLAHEDRILVSKLAAILRVADALDRCHQGKITDLQVVLEEERVVLKASCTGDLTLEQWGLRRKSDLFEAVFGLKAVVVGQT